MNTVIAFGARILVSVAKFGASTLMELPMARDA